MSFHISQERPMPKLWLAKPNKKIIQRLNGIENLQGTFNYMNQNQITFDVNSHIFDEMTQEQKKNPAIHKVKNKYLIKFVYNGQEDWFVINSKSEQAQEKDYISITADYIGKELDTKRIGDIEEIGITIGSLFNKFLPVVALNWSVRHIDPKLAKIKREYNLSDASVSSMIEAVCEQTDAVAVFHNFDRQISFIHRDNAGKFKGLKVKESTYLKSFTDTQNSADLVTRLYLMGKDGLTINGINPAGTSYIEDFSYFMKPFERDSNRRVIRHSDYMSDALCHALLDYQEYFSNRQGDYEKLSEDYEKLLKEQLEEDFKLSEISATLSNLEERIEVLKPRGGYTEKRVRNNTSFNMMYNTYYMMTIQNKGSLARITVEGKEYMVNPNEYAYIKIKTPSQVDVGEATLSYPVNILASNPNLVIGLSTSSEEDFREEDVKELDKKYNVYKYRELYATQYAIVTAVEKRVEIYNQNRKDINDSLSVQSFFTPELLAERENFINDGMWREENHTDAKELLEDGRKQLAEKNNVVRTTQVDIIDFVQSLEEEDQKNWDKLVAGDKIRFSNDTYDSNLEAFISELSISFDENDVTLTLSDVIDLSDKSKGVANQLAGFMSTANQVNKQKSQIDENAGKTNEVLALLEAEWDANKRRILAGNETVDIGAHGIKITSPTHPNEMLMAVAGVIAISDDYGETFKQAINTRGVVAERLIGKVILGTELVMENNSGTMRFDDEGVRINASNFHLIADDGENYFDNLLQSIEQEFVTYEEKIKEDIKYQKESFESELADVSKGLTEYTDSLLDSLADGVLTAREIDMLKLQMHMLEADYAQVRRRIIPLVRSTDADPSIQEQLHDIFFSFEKDYELLVSFIKQLDKPDEVPEETIKEIKELLLRFKPAIEELVGLAETNLNNIQKNQIANAEYNSRTFAENLMVDLEDEISDLNDALEGFDLSFKGALADGVIDMIERSQISDTLMKMKSEKSDVDNRYVYLSVHENLKNTSQLTTLQNSKREYDTSFNTLINRINYILARDKVTPEMIEDYQTAYAEFTAAMVKYSAIYEESLEYVQNRYADTKAGEAQKYADGLKLEVDADIKDVSDNVTAFADDVYGAFKDGIITEQERNRLDIHRKMLEKEKSDVIERYNTIITSRYLQGFFDTEKLVQARALYGEVHADLLLQIELAMMDDEITKEEADTAVRLFAEYVERLTEFSVQLELAIAAIGHSKAVWQTEEELKNYISVSVFNDEIAQMQAALDGHIMTWYYDYEPTLDNIPAKDWTTIEEKNAHIGDLFYHEKEGFAYRFMKSGSTYKWELIKDTEVTKALQDAQHALDLADDKRRVFVTTPTAPYDIGDLWIMGDGELMRARTARKESESYVEIDWIKATKYTDDTKANAVENQLIIFQKNVNTELDDLSDTYEAFKKTVEGTFKDGIIEDYELKILLSQAQSLDREKADVDALYNQLLNRTDLISSERSTLVSKYNSFSSTHQTLVSGIRLAIEDGKISDEELEAVTIALENYPQALKDIREYLHKLINDVITRVSDKANDALEGVQRFDTWKSSSFEVDSEKIATRVGESSWETKWQPVVNQNIDNIQVGGVNLANWTDTTTKNKENIPLVGRANELSLVTLQGEKFFQARVVESLDSTSSMGVYVGRKNNTSGFNSYFDIEQGQEYTLTLRGDHSSTVEPFSYVFIMRDDNLEKPDSTTSGNNQGVSRALVDRVNVETGYGSRYKFTFTANWSSRKAYLLLGTNKKAGYPNSTSYWFRFKEIQLEKGNKATDYKLSQKDQEDKLDGAIDDFYNTEIKSNYSTTTQTKALLGSYVTNTEMQGNLDKIATGYGKYLVSNTEWKSLREAGGSAVSDTFSYEVTARRTTNSDTLFVAVFNSRGTGKGWDREILEQKGSTSWHPEIYNTAGGDIRVRLYGGSATYEVEVVYTKYAGSFTNLSKTNSMIEQKADEINSRVNQLQSGGSNLVPDSDFSIYSTPPSSWSAYGGDAYLNSIIRFGKVLLIQTNNPRQSSSITLGAVTAPLTYDVRAGETYTLSFSANTGISASGLNYCYLMNTDNTVRRDGTKNNMSLSTPTIIGDSDVNGSGNEFKRYKITFEADWNGRAHMLIGSYIPSDAYTYIYLADVQVEKGTEASIYSPSTLDEYNRYSEIKQTAEGISTEVSKKVGNNEIISKINQSAERVSIDADKIDLTAGSNLKLAVDNALRGGSAGVNLIGNTDFWINYDDFERTHIVSNTDETLKQSVILNKDFGKGWLRFKRVDGALSYMWTRRSGRNFFSITKGRTYTFSVLAATNWNNELNYVHMRGENSPSVTQTLHGSRSDVTATRERIGRVDGKYVYKHTYTFTAEFSTSRGLMIFGLNNAPETTAGFYLSEWKLEEGDVATPYQERLTGNNIISQINADETSMVISSSKVSITADDINIDGKTIQIGSNPAITGLKDDVNDAQSTASDADSRARAARNQADAARNGNNVVNSINNSGTTVNISGDRINIDGTQIQLGGGASRSINAELKNARDGAKIADSINSASTSVRIMGDHINLTGNVTFENTAARATNGNTAYNRTTDYEAGNRQINPNVMSDYGMTTISGGNIQTDQMTAKRINIVRDDGVEVTNNGRLKNDFIVASFSPNFMSQPRADGGNASWDIFYQRGQWWTFNKYENGYNRTDPRTFNAYSFNHSARYLMIEMAINSPSDGTGLFIEVSEFSTPSGVTSFGAVSRGWTKNEANGGYYTFQIDLGKPSFKRRNFYLKAWPNSQGTNASVAQFRILRMTQNDDSWY